MAPHATVGRAASTSAVRMGASDRSAAKVFTPSSANVMSFFQSMERGLEEERCDIKEEGDALQATLRHQERLRRFNGDQRNGAAGTGTAREARPRSSFSGRRSARTASGSRGDGGYGRGRNTPPASAVWSSAPHLVPGASLYLDAWQKHDAAWAMFQAEPPDRVSAETVPWPPCSEDVLEFSEKLCAPGYPKQAYKIACRRWHPDKFLQLYGALVLPGDLPDLTSRLNEVFQAWRRSGTACRGRSRSARA